MAVESEANMKIITKEIEKLAKKYPLYSQDAKGDEAVVFVKFFDPTGSATWYITEMNIEKVVSMGNKQHIEGTAFGYVTGLAYDELGYVDLNELFSHVGLFGLGIERDLHYNGKMTLGEIKRNGHV